MRIVAVASGGGGFIAETDLGRRRPGRGAWLHPSPACFDLALRRRAFTRALRCAGPLDTTGLSAYVAQLATSDQEHDQEQHQTVTQPGRGDARRPEAGYSADEHPMSSQQ
jgi:predicted RNA-binding protein YlxR (DUF448 family)